LRTPARAQSSGRRSDFQTDFCFIDELGYVPLAEVAAELLFQVIADRAEKAAVIVTTNLPFSEWPQVFTNARLCKAVLDRLTDQAHIIETGAESYRFRRTFIAASSCGHYSGNTILSFTSNVPDTDGAPVSG
jgi:hypothetical protein